MNGSSQGESEARAGCRGGSIGKGSVRKTKARCRQRSFSLGERMEELNASCTH